MSAFSFGRAPRPLSGAEDLWRSFVGKGVSDPMSKLQSKIEVDGKKFS